MGRTSKDSCTWLMLGRRCRNREASIISYSIVGTSKSFTAVDPSTFASLLYIVSGGERIESSVLLRSPGWHHNTLLDGELVLDVVEEAHGPSLPEALICRASAKVDMPRPWRRGFVCLSSGKDRPPIPGV